MDSYDVGQLVYLSLLGAAVAGWFLTENRQSLGKTARQAIAWGLIFLGTVAAIGLWNDIRNTVLPSQRAGPDGSIELPRAPDGHYYATLEINGRAIEFVVDTGATSMVLTQDDARRVGFDLSELTFYGEAMTANGPVKTAPIRLRRVSFGPFHDERVAAQVNGGEMDQSLLGMSYLQRFQSIEISGNTLRLKR